MRFGSGDPAEVRFWKHVNRLSDSECWLWTAAVVMNYGHFTCDDRLPSGHKKGVKAHRFSWALANGPIPDGLHILHKCNVQLCVNPKHLYAGTHTDNMADRARAGHAPDLRGERSGMARLTNAQVAEIRKRLGKERSRSIAADYGVAEQTISDIRHGHTWKVDHGLPSGLCM